MKKLHSLLKMISDPGAIMAAINWPKFSLTSFQMIRKLKKQGIEPKTVLDVGGNVGQFAVASAKIWNPVRVYTWEAVPSCVDRLAKNVSSLSNIKIYPVALGEEESQISFNVNKHSHSSSILPLASGHIDAFPDAQEVDQITVEMSTLDILLDSEELQSPILLKIDVQGYELNVLRGANKLLKKVDYILLETSFKSLYEGEPIFLDVVQFMWERGFRFLRPVDWLSHPETGEILQADALFCKEGGS